MTNELKNILLAGLGSAAYTYEKASKIVDDLVNKGKLTVNEGKELSEELRKTVKNTSEGNNAQTSFTKEDLTAILREMNFATKDELMQIKDRLNTIEQRLFT